MGYKNILTQAKVLFGLILLNFLAQIPYFFHLYFRSQPLIISMRSFLILGAVFAFFLTTASLLFKGHTLGYPLMIIFLATEFLFYLYGLGSSKIHGFGPFFQVRNPDILLRVVYSIGYLNLFACGYFLFLLVRHRDFFRS